mgnify:CR=1 FL=1
MGAEIIRVENITFGYGKAKVLDDVSTSIVDGDFIGIVGPNGSGKSTLLRIFLGLIKPQKGTVRVFDTDIEKFNQWGKIGSVSYTHLRAHETPEHLVCRLLLEKKKKNNLSHHHTTPHIHTKYLHYH